MAYDDRITLLGGHNEQFLKYLVALCNTHLDPKQALLKASSYALVPKSELPEKDFSIAIAKQRLSIKMIYNAAKIITSSSRAEYYSEIQLVISWAPRLDRIECQNVAGCHALCEASHSLTEVAGEKVSPRYFSPDPESKSLSSGLRHIDILTLRNEYNQFIRDLIDVMNKGRLKKKYGTYEFRGKVKIYTNQRREV